MKTCQCCGTCKYCSSLKTKDMDEGIVLCRDRQELTTIYDSCTMWKISLRDMIVEKKTNEIEKIENKSW